MCVRVTASKVGSLSLSLSPSLSLLFSLRWQVTHVSSYVRRPFPSKETRRILERGDPAARCTRGSGDRFGIPKPRESGSAIGANRRGSWPSCVLPKGVPQGQRESGDIELAAICWALSVQRRCHPEEALYLPTFTP